MKYQAPRQYFKKKIFFLREMGKIHEFWEEKNKNRENSKLLKIDYHSSIFTQKFS